MSEFVCLLLINSASLWSIIHILNHHDLRSALVYNTLILTVR